MLIILFQVFNQSGNGSQVKNIINVFKGDANVRVTAVDTSSLYNCDTKDDLKFDKRVKSAFHRCLRQFRGGVIAAETFQPDVTHRPPNFPPAHTVKVSTLLSAYITEEQEKRQKPGSNRQGILKIESDEIVVLNFEPLREDYPDFFSQKAQVTLCGLVSEQTFPIDQHFEAHFSVWPPRDQPSWSTLFDRMRRNRQKLLVGFGEDRIGVISPTHDSSGILSLLSKNDSAFYRMMTRLKKIVLDSSLPENVQLLLDREIENNLDMNQLVPPPKSVDSKNCRVIPFQADCFDSWKVPETKPFDDVISMIKAQKESRGNSSNVLRDLQRAYLPARVSFLMDKKMGKFPSDGESSFSRQRSEESIVSHIR
jgi:hypothetical protein